MALLVARYKFILASAVDLSNIGELTQARSRTFEVKLNSPGNASFTVPMNDELSANIWPLSSALKIYRTGSTGQKLVWSGYVNTIDEDATNNHMQINCVGWQERLSKRFLRQRLIYANVDDGDLVMNLLAQANTSPFPDAYAPTVPAGSNPNNSTWLAWGGKLPNEGAGGATAYTTALRNRTYELYQSIGQSINELVGIENGCDVWVDPATRMLYVYRKRRRILTNTVFGFGWGPNNIQQFNRTLDGSTVTNYYLATGRTGVTGQYQHDAASQGSYNLIEEMQNLADVSDTNILNAYAGGEILMRAQPRQIFNVTPFPYSTDKGVPEPFVDYDVGDQARLVAKKMPRLNVDQQVRVFGIQVGVDEEGNERLGALQLSPGS